MVALINLTFSGPGGRPPCCSPTWGTLLPVGSVLVRWAVEKVRTRTCRHCYCTTEIWYPSPPCLMMPCATGRRRHTSTLPAAKSLYYKTWEEPAGTATALLWSILVILRLSLTSIECCRHCYISKIEEQEWFRTALADRALVLSHEETNNMWPIPNKF